MKRLTMWGWVILGSVIFVIGAILLPFPIPFGALLMVMGLFLMSSHPVVMRLLRRARSKFPGFSAQLRKITPMMPAFLARFLRRTDSGESKKRRRFSLPGRSTKSSADTLDNTSNKDQAP